MNYTRNYWFIRILRGVLRPIFHIIFYTLKWFKIYHGEKLPKKPGTLILCCNHAALVDSIYLILAIKARFTICGAKPRFFSTPLRRLIMSIANIIEVENHAQFLQDCHTLLQKGEMLLIYPEMGRNPERLGTFKTWAAEVALQNQVPILPCYLFGTASSHTGSPYLIVGNEIKPQGDADTLTQSIRNQIATLALESNS
jgi:1-acyl-sn-glycerol-3-phosphate acyltransferase